MSAAQPIVVTGGAGFIGSHVVERLLAEDRRLVVLDDLSTGLTGNLPATVDLERLDLAEPAATGRLARLRPAAVVHCAAQVSVEASVRDPARDARANVVASLNVLQGALEGRARRFIYLSTGGAVYGHADSLPSREDDRIAPLSPYGWSKWIVERYLDTLATGRMAWTALRLANVYGPRQRADGEGGVVAIFAHRMRRRAPVVIEGDGEQTRDFVFVADVAEAISSALSLQATTIINIGTGTATSVNRLFAELAAISAYTGRPSHVAPRPGDVRYSVLDVRRAAEILRWKPATSLREGLTRTYEAVEHGE